MPAALPIVHLVDDLVHAQPVGEEQDGRSGRAVDGEQILQRAIFLLFSPDGKVLYKHQELKLSRMAFLRGA